MRRIQTRVDDVELGLWRAMRFMRTSAALIGWLLIALVWRAEDDAGEVALLELRQVKADFTRVQQELQRLRGTTLSRLRLDEVHTLLEEQQELVAATQRSLELRLARKHGNDTGAAALPTSASAGQVTAGSPEVPPLALPDRFRTPARPDVEQETYQR